MVKIYFSGFHHPSLRLSHKPESDGIMWVVDNDCLLILLDETGSFTIKSFFWGFGVFEAGILFYCKEEKVFSFLGFFVVLVK